MDRFQFFHLCNHKFPLVATTPSVHTISVENSGDFIDILIERARILDIIEVRVTSLPEVGPSAEFDFDNEDDQNYEDLDVQDGYFDDDTTLNVDYRPFYTNNIPIPSSYYGLYLHNRIKWSVKPPAAYSVTARVLFSSGDYQTYEKAECPRCQGNAWYIDLFNTNSVFQSATGIEYVAQRIIKDLFTEISSNPFDLTYGTTLQRQMFQMDLTDSALFNHIRSAVSDVQRQYLLRQAPLLTSLVPAERLISLAVANVERSPNFPSRILLDLMIRTEVDVQSLRIPLFGGGA